MKTISVATIAGSDVSGGAGIQSDLCSFHNMGVHGCSVITAITAQTLSAITAIEYVSPVLFSAQLQALPETIKALKIGLLGNQYLIKLLKDYLKNYRGFVVLDPLLFSSSGQALFDYAMEDYLMNLKSLFPYIDLLTPNLFEAEKILSQTIITRTDIVTAAQAILDLGVKSVLIKGGHGKGEYSEDYWTNGIKAFWLASPRYPNRHCHGTGCVFSAIVTACIASDYSREDALVIAKMYINRGLRSALASDKPGLFPHQQGWPLEGMDLPYLYNKKSFFSLDTMAVETMSMGLYPIIDSVESLKPLLSVGIQYCQLRIKNLIGQKLEEEIATCIALATKYQIKLYINDHWELAIKLGAYGVHLGQDDLLTADIASIQTANLRLGISTHCYEEVARAHVYKPSYIACGPIFETDSKVMPFAPQGLKSLAKWRTILPYPLVAIGGINLSNIESVLATGVQGIALISAISTAENPQRAADALLKKVTKYVA